MKGETRQILLHIIGCITFLSLPVLFAPDLPESLNIFRSVPTQRNLIAYLLMIAFFYLNFFVLIPKFYYTKKYLLFFLIILFCFIIVSLLPSLIIPEGFRRPLPPEIQNNFRFRNEPPPPNQSFPFYITQYLFIFIAVVFFSLILRISNRWKQTEKEKLNAELSYLKAQINPHFLFNTLNSIYSLALEKSDNTATAVVKLSGMMRYVLDEADNDFVLLEKEINYISSYIELQRIRYGNSIQLSFLIKGNTAGKKIAPLILIPFVENAFKHGVNAEENSDIKIEINIDKNELNLLVTNNKVSLQQLEENKSGLGIENAKDRLELLYPAKHELHIHDNETFFSVSLNLNLE